jgi:hypothetical protein
MFAMIGIVGQAGHLLPAVVAKPINAGTPGMAKQGMRTAWAGIHCFI